MFLKALTIFGLPVAVLAATAGLAAAKDVKVIINWGSSAREDRSVGALRASVWPKVRNSICNTYRRGQYPGRVLKLGDKVIVTFVGSSGEVLVNLSVTRDKC